MQRTRFLTALVGLLLITSQCFAAPKVSVLGGRGRPELQSHRVSSSFGRK